MSKHWLITLLLTYTVYVQGQVNLVPNPSFEQYYSCPDNTSQVDSCIGWHSVLESPDYYNTCAPYPVSIPDNFCGYQSSFDGNAYIGLITYAWHPPNNYREIIGTTLLDTMIIGNIYEISMRVTRGNWTNQVYNCSASNKLGVRFSTAPLTTFSNAYINNYASVYTDSIISDTTNWLLLSWVFVADSAYTNFYIGNFFDDANTDTLVISAPFGQFGIAYYYIDSINIFCNSINCINSVLENDWTVTSIFYNIETNEITLTEPCKNILSLTILNSLGQICKQVAPCENNKIPLPILSNGIYYAVLQTANKTVSTKFIIN